jgi:hypothetical protein
MTEADPAAAYGALRASTVALLGLDPDSLSLTQDLQVDLLSLLRLEVDSLQGKVLAGEAVDLNRLSVAFGMLQKLLPAAELRTDSNPADVPDDARAKLANLIDGLAGATEHEQARVEREETVRLKTEIAELRVELARSRAGAVPSAPGAQYVTYVDAGAGDGPSPTSPPMGMDDPLERAKRAESERIRAIATRPRLEEWRPYVGGGYSTGFGIHSIPKDF